MTGRSFSCMLEILEDPGRSRMPFCAPLACQQIRHAGTSVAPIWQALRATSAAPSFFSEVLLTGTVPFLFYLAFKSVHGACAARLAPVTFCSARLTLCPSPFQVMLDREKVFDAGEEAVADRLSDARMATTAPLNAIWHDTLVLQEQSSPHRGA